MTSNVPHIEEIGHQRLYIYSSLLLVPVYRSLLNKTEASGLIFPAAPLQFNFKNWHRLHYIQFGIDLKYTENAACVIV